MYFSTFEPVKPMPKVSVVTMPEFSFFPQKLDNHTLVEYDVSDLSIKGCMLRSLPGLSHFKVSVILKGSDGKSRRAEAMISKAAVCAEGDEGEIERT